MAESSNWLEKLFKVMVGEYFMILLLVELFSFYYLDVDYAGYKETACYNLYIEYPNAVPELFYTMIQ